MTRLSQEEALQKYIGLLTWYKENGYTEINDLLNTIKSEKWQQTPTDKKLKK